MIPIIEMRGVTRSYRIGPEPLPVLISIDLEVRAGEFVAIVGQSGSGKSTLLNLLGLLDTPDGGDYRLDGRDVARLDDDSRTALRNRVLGFVFQSSPLLPRLTALENVALPLLYRGVRPRVARDRAGKALEQFGLAARSRQRPAELSGGQQQRVALARAIVGEPRVLLADEPTAALDPVTASQVLDELVSLHREQGLTLVLVTHEPESAARAQRRLELRDGRLRAAAPRMQPV